MTGFRWLAESAAHTSPGASGQRPGPTEHPGQRWEPRANCRATPRSGRSGSSGAARGCPTF
eukprot:637388-Pyramimonas_sp.AAC.1